MATYYAVYKSVDDVLDKKGKALEVTSEQYLNAFRPEEDELDEIVVFKDEKSALKVAKDGFNAKATDQFPIFTVEVEGKLKKGTVTLEDGKTKVAGFVAPVAKVKVQSASLAYLNKGFEEVDLTEKPDNDNTDDNTQKTASTFPWKLAVGAASAVGAISAAFHYAGGMNLLAAAAAKIGVAVPAAIATAPAAAVAFGVGVLTVSVAAGLYSLAKLATSYFVKTDKQRYEAAVKVEDDAVRTLEDKLDAKNKNDENFVFELDSFFVEAPEAKFNEAGAAVEGDDQPKINKLHVLQYAHKKLEAIVEIKNAKERAQAEEKLLDKLHTKLGV